MNISLGNLTFCFAGSFKTSVAGADFVDIGLTISNQNSIDDTESSCL